MNQRVTMEHGSFHAIIAVEVYLRGDLILGSNAIRLKLDKT